MSSKVQARQQHFQNAATNGASSSQLFEGKSAFTYFAHGHDIEATTQAAPSPAEDSFQDSGFFDDESYEYPQGNDYEDFILYADEPPFISEDASMIANHGSIYNGKRNERISTIDKYTSYNYDEIISGSSADEVTGASNNHMKSVSEGQHVPADRPSLFSGVESISGPSPLSEWVTTRHRHESNAYRFEQPPYPTGRLQALSSSSPSPSSSSIKRHRTKSGKGRRRH